jgi:gamma-glutamyltranspeptidase/glutathione hydrolase
MRRDSFLKATLLGAASLAGGILTPLRGASSKEQQTELTLDREQLQARNQNRSTVVSRNGMVCTAQPLASTAGIDILKRGGNAIDAAICANATLSVVEPMSCGPGGDLFAIVWIEKDRKLYGLNASGRSPYNWSLMDARAMGLTAIPEFSPLSWSVPGCVSGWQALLDRFGILGFKDLLETPIHHAREGFPVSPVIARSWSGIDTSLHSDGVEVNSRLFPTYAPDGRAPRFGDIFRNPGLADFFKIITKGGGDAFYQGEIAERIVRFSEANGGRFTMRDFKDHTADWIDPVSTNYRGYDVWELPPNGQGIATLQILNLLEHFDIGALEPNSAEQLHLFIEAKKLAFEDRAVYYADMDFAPVPLQELISKSYAEERVKLINRKRAASNVPPGMLSTKADTTYLTTADSEGNMVSLIQSTYYGFGSKYVPDGLGFALQNRGLLFALDPNHLNELEPHKRPFHTIIPGFVTKNGEPTFAFGVMGGGFQPQGQAQVLMNIIDYGMSVQQAGDQPRVAHYESSQPTGTRMSGPGVVIPERGISEKVLAKLGKMGHHISSRVGAHGGYQGIWRKDEPRRYFGASESRKDGVALGY